jgi:hypothetical protein
MSAETFFSRFGSLLPGNPTAATDSPMVDKMAKLGIYPGKPFDLSTYDPEKSAAKEQGAKEALNGIVATAKKGIGESAKGAWAVHRGLGQYGTQYGLRAMVAWGGLGANLAEDAIYPNVREDSDGRPFNGAQNYVLHFDPGQTPTANAFWSLTMYNERQAFVENPIGRYAIGDRDHLKFNDDDSLDIVIQHEDSGPDRESNWLPAPAESFNLIMRIYWPKQAVLEGSWTPPPVKRAGV